MATTPEGKVKKRVQKVLADSKRFGYIYSYWPVPAGYGAPTLDCIVCYRGVFISIETKRPGGKPTARQKLTIEDMLRAGAIVIVQDTEDTTLLETILEKICHSRPEKRGLSCVAGRRPGT